jgi:DNA polymerase-4
MDAFFASVEQRDNPELRGLPVAVGGGGPRGVVAAASYEARVYGVRSAMPGRTAERACPDLIFVKARMDAYREVGAEVRAIFARFTDLIEPLSLDEAYLDVTEYTERTGSTARAVAQAIKAAVREELRLTVSAGVSNCKFVAKIASGWRKPDGLTVIPPDRVAAFVAALPIGRFHGVGPATAAKLQAMGIETGADLRAFTEDELQHRFGKFGSRLYQLARGIDERPVEAHQERKSVSAETTFDTDLSGPESLAAALDGVLDSLLRRLERAAAGPWCTVTLKIRTDDFRTSTRSRSFRSSQADSAFLRAAAHALLTTPALPARPVRLLGIGVSNFVQPSVADQLPLPFESALGPEHPV